MTDLENLNFDPYGNEPSHENRIIEAGTIHIHIQQRQGRKTTTLIQGIAPSLDKKKLLKAFKKEFACNGAVSTHKELGEVCLLQGDHRQEVYKFFIKHEIAKKENIKIHGF